MLNIWHMSPPASSTNDAITTTLHLALTHLDKKDTYIRMLLIDFSSTFNTIILMHLTRKLSLLGLLDFLTGRGIIESLLGSCITAWFGNCTRLDHKNLQRVLRMAEKIIGVTLPSISDINTTHCIRKATSIVKDPTHPSHRLFSPFHLTEGTVAYFCHYQTTKQLLHPGHTTPQRSETELITFVALLYAVLHHCLSDALLHLM